VNGDEASPRFDPPSVALPKGGGAIRGIGEKFGANAVTGTGSFTVPISTSPGRSGFGPQLRLTYDSAGAGNGPFGFGWTLTLPSISRKTDKGLPLYHDADESDVFILWGDEDLVPVLRTDGTRWESDELDPAYVIHRYRPRVERSFARIERWTRRADGDVHWRSISRDNVLVLYGKDKNGRIADPADSTRVYRWLISEMRDDRGNAVLYEYKPEDGVGVDLAQAHERNRGDRDDPRRAANRYLKRIRYGNRTSLLDAIGQRPVTLTDAQISDADWMFEVVFDYGEHDSDAPTPQEVGDWGYRMDPFSTYRAGFEVRTARLCQRVLMFHHFASEPGVGVDCLVRSTDFHYSHEDAPGRARGPVYTLLLEVSESGYRRQSNGYVKQRVPPVEFEYTEAIVDASLRTVDEESLEGLPVGVDGTTYAWIDLHGEGIPGILTEQGEAWLYKRNVSPIGRRPVEFATTALVIEKPNVEISAGGTRFMDLAGDGQLDLVVLGNLTPGMYEHEESGETWGSFKPFASGLNIDFNDPNLRLVDLDGDGRTDVLISADDTFVWHASLGECGFGSAQSFPQALDDEEGPRAVFSSRTESIYLADMSGDGLSDLVRVRNGECCYWPNLGRRFGARVTMDHAPHFDFPDEFDQDRLRLADIDGTGTTDLIYLHRAGARLYFNQSGNSWSVASDLDPAPAMGDVVDVHVTDLLGNGTACLVWSSALPSDQGRAMRYVDLMGGAKPHLLVRTTNNLGAESRISYASSTKFFLQDKRDGRPWITRLPFPVHVVERVETFDHTSGNRFVTRYAYHHGHFDGEEREFRGFGMVEQWDTEEIDALTAGGAYPRGENITEESHVPPVHTKTWFQTGTYFGREHVTNYFAGLESASDRGEYFREPGLNDDEARALLLPDTVIPTGLTVDEEREACRSLKGAMLRQEVYADDAGPGVTASQLERAAVPYTVTEQSFSIRALQAKGPNRHAVFFTHAQESISFHYERNAADPRIQHVLTLEVDDHGNVLKQATAGYGRRTTVRYIDTQGRVRRVPNPALAGLADCDRPRQTATLVTYTESRVTNAIESAVAHRNPVPCETITFELTGHAATGPAGRFQPADLVEPDPDAAGHIRHKLVDEVPYEEAATANPCRRPIECLRTLYRRDDLTSLLPLGITDSLALPGESYKLVFTPGLIAQVYERPRGAEEPPEALLPDPASVLGARGPADGGYVASQALKADGRFPATDADDTWWLPTGRSFFTATPTDRPAAELAAAREHFFVPRRYRDPFGQDAVVDFDGYDLLLVETHDALGNRVTVDCNDYRVLQPRIVSDPNRNQTEVVFDALGLVVGTALMGKPHTPPVEGDSLAGFVVELSQAQLDEFFNAQDPHAGAHELLRGATTRILYDIDRFHRTRRANPGDPRQWQPPCIATLARETHAADPLPPEGLKIQIGFTYSDGFGREIQKKIQAEPGAVAEVGADVNPRWVGSGWTVFNNKGKPVRKYEPFFSATHHFELAVMVGVSPVVFYDPVGRAIATLHPNCTFEKVVFDPWQQTTFDVNDTCAPRAAQTGDPRTDPDIRGYVAAYFRGMQRASPAPAWQTWYAARIHGALGANEQAAAMRTSAHADTPTTAHLDVLGRTFLTVGRNRVVCTGHDFDGTETTLSTRVELDVEGNERAVHDADQRAGDPLGRLLVRYAYDMLGNRIYQVSMDAGARWMLNDVMGKPVRAWDSRGHNFITSYDAMRRPVDQIVRGTTAESDARTLDRDTLVGRIEYGESVANAEALNLRTRSYRHFDSAGIATDARLAANGDPLEAYDFKGNLLCSTRQLMSDYTVAADWLSDPQLDDERFESSSKYDALNRTIQSIAPHSSVARAEHLNKVSVIQSVYNEANLLERVDVWLDREVQPDCLLDPAFETPSTVGVASIDYDAKGRRVRIEYRNGANTRYCYDPATFRLTELHTVRGPATSDGRDDAEPAGRISPPARQPQGKADCLQSLYYTYDPVGNITHIDDSVHETVFFKNRRVKPSKDFIYDALYQLIQATGREHLGQGGVLVASHEDGARFSPNDGNAMATYVERYVYDVTGNLLRMDHRGSDAANAGWTRLYDYLEPSLIEDGSHGDALKRGNRLTRTTINPNGAEPQVEAYQHDVHGNIVRMPHLGAGSPVPNMQWDYRDQLRQIDLGGGGVAHYVYDAGGKRVRKVRAKTAALIEERIYIGVFEIYRKHCGPIGADTATLERETLHVTYGEQRVALVETRSLDIAGDDQTPARLIRYQFGDHLASSVLELDDRAQIVSYEEYAPYGTSTYQAVRSQTETPKRFRFTGKERDDESGFYYHGARYFASWLGRWTSADPIGLKGGLNLYAYCENSPAVYTDPLGLDEWCGLSDGFFGLFDSECHVAPEVSGTLKAVGGAAETVAGGAMVIAGGATCEFGVGCFVAAAGVAVVAHGVDTTQSGIRTAIKGEQIDSFTSLGLQELGMSRGTANIADAGISIVGTLGASAVTRAPSAAVAVTEGGAQTTPAVTLALRPALGPGHNYVAVTTADGVTTWSHLAVDGATKTSGVVTGGTSVVEGLEAAEMGGRLSRSVTVSVPVSASQAEAALGTVTRAIQTTEAAGEAGFGAYSLTSNSCSTYAASVMNSAGISTPALTSPALNFGAAALQSPTVVRTVSIGGGAVNTVVGVLGATSPTEQSSTSQMLQGGSGTQATHSPGIPNPADFNTFDDFSAAVTGPYSYEFIMQQWAAVRGWTSQ
jgi:RHS repeat-associated protein